MASDLQEWLKQGEGLYQTLLNDYQELERQIQDLQTRRAIKASELQQMARLLGRDGVDVAGRRMDVDLLSPGIDRLDDEGMPPPGTVELISPAGYSNPATANANIVRALAGKFSSGPGSGPAAAPKPPPKMIDAVPLRRS